MAEREDDLTLLLEQASAGDRDAQERAWRRAYAELHAMARGARRRFSGSFVPGEGTIVHEAFLKAYGRGGHRGASVEVEGGDAAARPAWESRAHFFGSLARAMAQYLIDWRRSEQRVKRGGGARPAHLGALTGGLPTLRPIADFDQAMRDLTPELVHELECLERDAPEIAAVVWLRYAAGLDVADTAAALGIGERTVSKRWNIGRALLRVRLARGGAAAESRVTGEPTDDSEGA